MTKLLTWLDCPYGRRNDSAPGLCSLYVDTNHNQICDHSEPPPTYSEGTFITETNLLFWTAFLTTGVYLATWYLYSRLQLRWLSYRYFWNWVFLAAFILTAGSGLFLLRQERGAWVPKVHLVSGVIFVVLALFHLWQNRHSFYRAKPQTKLRITK